MKLLVVSSAPFIYKKKLNYAYGPYINELVLWNKYADEIIFCCPLWQNENGLLIDEIPFKIKEHYQVADFNLNTFICILKAPFFAFHSIVVLFKAMQKADHIHLRCPGNIGLLGCFIQVLFPNTPKTAKYAGNWDPKSKQPWTYRLQQWILSNTFFTRNMQVLVYGQWEGSSSNIKPFFNATYREKDKLPILKKEVNGRIDFVFVGALVKGKHPLYTVQLVENLYKKGYNVYLSIFGEGVERKILVDYIVTHSLEKIVKLEGNQTKDLVKKAYQESHFVVLPSDSEGWPKAIAEGMFWGCIPIATRVSCVPYMLKYGKRGVLLDMNKEKDSQQIVALLNDSIRFDLMQKRAADWSQYYTMDFFEAEIKKILQL
jgi:glycosyltransferase involved in cell wall biosynthesis